MVNYSTKKISKRLESFRKYCKANNFELQYEDYAFIDENLDNFNRNDFKTILDHYLEEWAQGMVNAEKVSSACQDGRNRANLWLLEHSDLKKGKKGEYEKR